ncbi:MAG: bifunctional UDP-sugar hydrolase/5'-nucleotidase [Bacteroidales bacterium]|nr:bifunctional metallophosphatase/5'-nucleotidase [Bacteroidales bacterium]
MKKFLFYIIPIIFIHWGCENKEKSDSRQLEVIIVHTNDMHGSINNFPHLAALKDSLEQIHEHVLLVSAGDIFSGNPVVDQYDPRGFPIIDLMNEVGYHMSAIGNHEFDYGQKALKERMEQAEFPFLCANMKTAGSILPQPKPFHRLQIEGVELVFLSLLETGNQGKPVTHPAKVKGIKFYDPIQVAGQYIDSIEGTNAMIGLTHLGYSRDKQLIEQYHAFDVIIGGHSHTLLEKTDQYRGVLITQANDDMNYAGIIRLTFKKGELANKSSELVDLNTFHQTDKKVQAKVDKYNNNEALAEIIGYAASPIKGKGELGSLFTDAQTSMHNLDFAFQNNGGIRIDEIPKGEIRVKTIYALDPFGNELMKFTMTPAEMISLIRYYYNRSYSPGLRISGGTYTMKVNSSDEIEKIIVKDEQGDLLNVDSTYSVGLNSYISDSYDFEHIDEGESLNITTAENIIKYIKQQDTIDYSEVKRVYIEQTE